MKHKSIISIFIFFFHLTCLYADETEFSATVSKNSVEVGEQFTVTFTLNAEASNFQPPSFNDYFQVLSGPSRSSSQNMSWINGKTSRSISVSYTYTLIPVKEGKYSIGSASVTANGKTIRSNSIDIDVARGSANAQNPPAQWFPFPRAL